MGDPSGIGPEVVARSMASPDVRGLAIFVIVSDERIIREAAGGAIASRVAVLDASDLTEAKLDPEKINLVDPGLPIDSARMGVPSDEGSRKALECLKTAVRLMRGLPSDTPRALVTAPLSKENIARVHPGFVGHTEFLQEAYGADHVTMAFVGEKLNVIPVTRHIPLKEVADTLSKDLIVKTLLQVVDNRRIISGKEDSLILVAALNPHGGEGGKMGTEEKDIIEPAILEAKMSYKRIEGPIPADVAFYRAYNHKADIVVGMYHDQCLGPFKMLDFNTGVNMTLGLEHVRTSPDHGTAFDIAGKGIADKGSMVNAIKLAVRASIQE